MMLASLAGYLVILKWRGKAATIYTKTEHVSLTALLAFAVRRDFPRLGVLAFGAAAVVWFSTLVTRQHHLFDVATSVALALAISVTGPVSKSPA